MNTLVAAAAGRSEEFQTDVVDGLTLGLQGQRGVAKPAAWDAFAKTASASANAAFAAKVRALDTLVGGAGALDDARRVAQDASAAAPDRRAALQSLLDARAPDLRQIAEAADPRQNGQCRRGYRACDVQ